MQPRNKTWQFILTALDVSLITLCILLLYRSYNNLNGLTMLLAIVSGVVPFLNISAQVGNWKNGLLLATKSIVLCVVICVFNITGPPQCKLNLAVAQDMEAALAQANKIYTSDNAGAFITADSVEIAGKIAIIHATIIDSMLALHKDEAGGCLQDYESRLAKTSGLLIADFFDERRLRINLCNDINSIINERKQDYIDLLFLNYSIDPSAEVQQFDENNAAPHKWGSFKTFLNGIIVNGMNSHIQFKLISQIARNSPGKNITTISFINL